MTDLVQLIIKAGRGGHGKVSFRREKFVPKGGPSGGDGGNGGNIYIVARKNVASLDQLRGVGLIEGKPGDIGGADQMFGAVGADTTIEVPVGTVIWLVAENEVAKTRRMKYGLANKLAWSDVFHQNYDQVAPGEKMPNVDGPADLFAVDTSEIDKSAKELLQHGASQVLRDENTLKIQLIQLMEPDAPYLLCQGGFGGRGNTTFKSSVQTTPRFAQLGTPGELRVVLFEHKLLADVGFVGFPNAGKSTLLSVLTKAKPKVANYPFTTLFPNLGVCSVGDTSFVIADLPGLIEGASEGKGLGHSFLRHIEHCRGLVFVLALEESLIFDTSVSDAEKTQELVNQFDLLKKEFEEYGREIEKKPYFVAINKVDLLSEELQESITTAFKEKNIETLFVSGATQKNNDKLIEKMSNLQ